MALSLQLLPGAEGPGPRPDQPWSIPSRQLLSRCFRAWWQLVWRQQAVAVALSRRQLLRRGLQALRWALWLREAQLEVAWGRHTRALLGQSFHKVRGLRGGPRRGDETLTRLGTVSSSRAGGCQPT